MAGNVYVDESKRRDFVLVASVIVPNQISEARDQIRKLYLPGQRGLHMVKENSGRQKQILGVISDMGVDVRIYTVEKGALTGVEARQHCLRVLLGHMAAEGQTRLILDRDDSLVARDRQVIADELHRLHYKSQLQYSHDKSAQEPLLAVPDAIAWAWPQGGHWRQRCERVVTAQHHF